MFSCLQILEAFLWFVLITLLNVTLIILTLDRKSGSAGMPRPISYAVFCLKKKKSAYRVGGVEWYGDAVVGDQCGHRWLLWRRGCRVLRRQRRGKRGADAN